MINQQKKLLNTSKQIKYQNIFWFGFIIYAISDTFTKAGYLNFQLCNLIQSVGLLLMFSTGSYLVRFKFSNKYLHIVFVIYCLWLLSIILRGFIFEYDFIKNMLFDGSYGLMPYFVPFILLFSKSIFFYKKIFSVIIVFGIFYILFVAVSIRELLSADYASLISQGIVEYSTFLSFPMCFLLLTLNYHSTNSKILAIIVVTLTLFFAIFRARRGMIFICSSQIIFSYLLYLFYSRKRIVIIASTALFSMIIIYSLYDKLAKKDNSIFSFLLERGSEDTRSGVELAFYEDFQTKDWIIGRGIQGEYYYPIVEEDQITENRSVIETGYLQIILRGGLVSLVLILAIALPAIFLGLFDSKNSLTKAAGIWILLWLMYLYPATMEAFSLYYFIFWISVGICYSKALRYIPENRMKLLFMQNRL